MTFAERLQYHRTAWPQPVEALARELCDDDGNDPDAPYLWIEAMGNAMWEEYAIDAWLGLGTLP